MKEIIDRNNIKNLCKIFEQASDLFLKNQKKLILSGASERSWYTHFSMYLNNKIDEQHINGYYVDTEYNRNDGKLKTIFDNNSLEIIPITCDIIVHSRGENYYQDNLICIEMKKSDVSNQLKLEDKKD